MRLISQFILQRYITNEVSKRGVKMQAYQCTKVMLREHTSSTRPWQSHGPTSMISQPAPAQRLVFAGV